MFLMFPMIPTTLRLSQHCHTDHTANPKRALIDVVRLRGLRIGDGCIIRLVLILCYVILAVKHLKLRKWISQRVIGKLHLLLMAFQTGKMRRESLRSTMPVMYINMQLKSFIFYQEPREILVKVRMQHTRRRNG